MATIKDVAERAGVSVSTVSNLLNRKGNVSEEKYRRIMEIIDELNYRPNIIAQNLKRQKTKFIVLSVPSFDGIYTHIHKGVASVLEKEGYYLIVKTTGDNMYVEKRILDDIADLSVSGIVMVPVSPTESAQYADLLQKGIPTVFLERQSLDLRFSSVVFDNRSIVHREARQLFDSYEIGRISLVVGSAEYSSENDCVDGFVEAYQEWCGDRGIGYAERAVQSRVLRCSLCRERAFHSLFNSLSAMEEVPSCFIVSNSGVAEALREVLAFMSRDADVLALDGDIWCAASAKKANPKKIGRESIRLGIVGAELLLECLKNTVLFENKKITVRESEKSAPLRLPVAPSRRPLNVLLLDCPSTDTLMKLSSDFSSRSGREVRFEVLGYLDLHDQLLSRLVAGDATNDVVMVDIPWIKSFVENGYLVDFASLVEKDRPFLDDFPKSVRDAFIKTRSKIFGLPVVATLQYLFYRSDLFGNENLQWRFRNKYGFELSPPRNWTEFNIVAEFFNQATNPASPVEYGTAVNGLHPTGIVDEFLPRQWAFNGRMLDEKGRLEIDSPENLRALENLCRTFSLVSEECVDSWWDEEFKQLIEGRLSMVVGFASHYPIPAEEGTNSVHYNNIAVTEIPGSRPMLGGWILGINKKSDAVEDSYSFIRWATSDQNAVQHMLLGGAMPTNSACDNANLKLYLPWMTNIRDGFSVAGKREVFRDAKGRIIDPYWIDTQMSTKFLDALRGRSSPKQALAELEEILRGAKEAKSEVSR